VSELQQSLTTVSDAVARSLYVKMVAERLEIDERALLEKLRQESARQTLLEQHRRPALESGIPQDVGKDSAAVEHAVRYGDRVEKQIIAMMLQVPQSCHIIDSLDALALFENQSLARIGHVILDAHNRAGKPVSADGTPAGPAAGQWLADIMAGLTSDEDRRIVADVAMNAEGWAIEGCEKQILHFVETARKRRNQQDIEHRIKEAVRNKDDKLLEQLLSEKQTLAVKREKRKMALLDR
jgi:DNA primase